MSDPSQLEPETVGKGGALLVGLLGLFKFLFTTGVSEVKSEVAKLNALVTTLTTNVAALTTSMAVANEGRVTRQEFEDLRREVAGLTLELEHIKKDISQGVVG